MNLNLPSLPSKISSTLCSASIQSPGKETNHAAPNAATNSVAQHVFSAENGAEPFRISTSTTNTEARKRKVEEIEGLKGNPMAYMEKHPPLQLLTTTIAHMPREELVPFILESGLLDDQESITVLQQTGRLQDIAEYFVHVMATKSPTTSPEKYPFLERLKRLFWYMLCRRTPTARQEDTCTLPKRWERWLHAIRYKITSLDLHRYDGLQHGRLNRLFYPADAAFNLPKILALFPNLTKLTLDETIIWRLPLIDAAHKDKITSIDLSPGAIIEDLELASLAKNFPNLTNIDLEEQHTINDEGLELFAKNCRNLTTINLRHCWNITARGLECLSKNCPNLTSINLDGCHVNGSGFADLSKNCPKLTSINLSGCYITDAHLASLHCPNLISIDLTACHEITGTGFAALYENCPNLTNINFESCRKLTDEGLSTLHCPNLTSINLEGCQKITGTGLAALSKNCPNLTSINLQGCRNITDADLAGLHCLNLTSINLEDCPKITGAGFAVLSKNCPNLTSINLEGCERIADKGTNDLVTRHKRYNRK